MIELERITIPADIVTTATRPRAGLSADDARRAPVLLIEGPPITHPRPDLCRSTLL